jgi:hypothetical protein
MITIPEVIDRDHRRLQELHEDMTAGRRRWLTKLARGPEPRDHGAIPIQCARLGWTEYVWICDGIQVPYSRARRCYPSYEAMYEAGWRNTGLETLTGLGRQRFAEARR